MLFPPEVLERTMKVRDVILRTLRGEYSWLQAAEILGMSPRTVRRWRVRMERHGYTGLLDMRRGRPSPKRAPVGELQRILGLYRDRYMGFNVRHFHQIARREHGVKLSYSLVRQVLQGGGLVKRGRARGKHRRRREPKACFGEMLHLDGSLHPWLALVPEEKQSLITVVDDATKRLLYAGLFESESTVSVMNAIGTVLEGHGIPMALYTDRASWAAHTPKAGGPYDPDHLTQVGRALKKLGIEHIRAYSPQARGRGERINRTLQDRLVNELRVAGITTVEAANVYVRERFIPIYDETFSCPPRDPESAFVPLGTEDLEQILCHEEERTVAKDNTVSLDGLSLQIGKQKGRRSCAGVRVTVRRHLDGRHSVWLGTRQLSLYDAAGRALGEPLDKPTHQDPPGSTQPVRVDPEATARLNTYGHLPSGRATDRVRPSGRLRLPAARTRSSRG
jgi:transposase